jgi:hypothetical protein
MSKHFDAGLDETVPDCMQGVTLVFFGFMSSFLCLVSGFIPGTTPLASRVPTDQPHDGTNVFNGFNHPPRERTTL